MCFFVTGADGHGKCGWEQERKAWARGVPHVDGAAIGWMASERPGCYPYGLLQGVWHGRRPGFGSKLLVLLFWLQTFESLCRLKHCITLFSFSTRQRQDQQRDARAHHDVAGHPPQFSNLRQTDTHNWHDSKSITHDKLAQFMSGWNRCLQGDKLSDAELDRMMKAADADGDGMIDYKDFSHRFHEGLALG